MTKASLLKSIESRRGLASVPTITTDPRPFLARSLGAQGREMLRAVGHMLREMRKMAQLLGRGLLSLRWWLLLLGAVLCSVLILRPLVYRDIAGLNNLADVLSIVVFVISLAGMIRQVQRRGQG